MHQDSVLTIGMLALAAVLATAVSSDLRARRISNRLIAVGLVTAVTLHVVALAAALVPPAGRGAVSPLTGALCGAASLLPLYFVRGCAAGDVKLLAVVGAFLGAPLALVAGIATYVAGGVLALVFLLRRGVARQTAENLRSMVTPGHDRPLPSVRHTASRLPYAVAIASGTVAALAWQATL